MPKGPGLKSIRDQDFYQTCEQNFKRQSSYYKIAARSNFFKFYVRQNLTQFYLLHSWNPHQNFLQDLGLLIPLSVSKWCFPVPGLWVAPQPALLSRSDCLHQLVSDLGRIFASCLVSAWPVMVRVFAARDAWTLGSLKRITVLWFANAVTSSTPEIYLPLTFVSRSDIFYHLRLLCEAGQQFLSHQRALAPAVCWVFPGLWSFLSSSWRGNGTAAGTRVGAQRVLGRPTENKCACAGTQVGN